MPIAARTSIAALGLLSLVHASAAHAAEPARIRCASTTSTQNSGLFGVLLPAFEKKTGIKVDVIAVGTGQALALGRRGDVDVVFVHAKEDELRLAAEGWFVDRRDVMYNDFILLGPPSDPARVSEEKSAATALARIVAAGATFVSRGDDSGTHKMELALWRTAGIVPRGRQGYMEIGQGMEAALRVASEKAAYTLSDRGTWLAVKDKKNLALRVLLEGDPALFNQYGVMAVNPRRHPHARFKEAMAFIEWITSPEGQRIIATFRDKNGNPLFIPNAVSHP